MKTSKLENLIAAETLTRRVPDAKIYTDGHASLSPQSKSGKIFNDLSSKYKNVILIIGAKRRYKSEGTHNAVLAWDKK